jgi:hypothetical protein
MLIVQLSNRVPSRTHQGSCPGAYERHGRGQWSRKPHAACPSLVAMDLLHAMIGGEDSWMIYSGARMPFVWTCIDERLSAPVFWPSSPFPYQLLVPFFFSFCFLMIPLE